LEAVGTAGRWRIPLDVFVEFASKTTSSVKNAIIASSNLKFSRFTAKKHR
jgi:hypothetical protein